MQFDPRQATGPWAVQRTTMTHLALIQKAAAKRAALLSAQYSNAKAYRGIPYTRLTNMKPEPKCQLTYRGVPYNFG